MMQTLDQIFPIIAHWLAHFLPPAIQPLGLTVLKIAGIMAVFGTCFAVTTLAERKILGRMQNRYGPNRCGPGGVFQPLADAIKMLTKEDIVPYAADKVVHLAAPILLAGPVWLVFSVVPFGRNMTALDLDAGVLFFFAVGSMSELSVFMAGWSSQNKYSLVGAMRAVAQMLSYEVPLVMCAVPVVMLAGTMSLGGIVEAQAGYTMGVVPRWNALTPWGAAAFVMFLIAAAAESNRSPFDLPEGESELIAGYLTEYSGFKYALFFLGEYLGLFAGTALAVTLFLGGWNPPLECLAWMPTWFWFAAKFAALIFGFIWTRATLPRLRQDQLLNVAWKFLVPMALLNLFVAAFWHWSGDWPQFFGHEPVRWLADALPLAVPYALIARKVSAESGARREYRYVN